MGRRQDAPCLATAQRKAWALSKWAGHQGRAAPVLPELEGQGQRPMEGKRIVTLLSTMTRLKYGKEPRPQRGRPKKPKWLRSDSSKGPLKSLLIADQQPTPLAGQDPVRVVKWPWASRAGARRVIILNYGLCRGGRRSMILATLLEL